MKTGSGRADGRRLMIGRRLSGWPGIHCLGPRPSLATYEPAEMELIRSAPIVYYPTRLLAQPLKTLGKPTYPSAESHFFGQNKVRQLSLFTLAGLPLPRTGIYHGRQKERIAAEWPFPFIAKIPYMSARGSGVFLIRESADLDRYIARPGPAYIQEYLTGALDVRVVIVNGEHLVSYLRTPAPGEFRANLALGGRAVFDGVPTAAVDLALHAARLCNLDEIGLDVLMHRERAYLLEANFLFGRRALTQAGLDLKTHVHRLIVEGIVERRLGL